MTLYRKTPPCPDPDLYVLVKTKEGQFWRRKRGSVTAAPLNRSLQQNASLVGQCSPAARLIAGKLGAFTRSMAMGRLQGRLTAVLMKWLKQHGSLSLAALEKFDFQPKHPLTALVAQIYKPVTTNGTVGMAIRPWEGAVEMKNALVTGYFFDGILLYGDLNVAYGLRTEVQTSAYYPFDREWRRHGGLPIINGNAPAELPPCDFSFTLPTPETPYALLLRVSCLEGNELAVHPMHYGMQVVGVGGVI